MAQKGADQVTLVDLTDGYSVYLEKYAHIFNGDTSKAVAGSTTCKVTAMVGPETVPCTVDLTAVTSPTGITVTKDSNSITPTLTIAATTSPAFTTPGFVTIPVVVDGGITIVQTMAVSFAKTGSGGAPGVSPTLVGLKNEAQMIPTDSSGKTLGASTITVDFYGYVGATRKAVTASVSGLPAGISVGSNTAGTASVDGKLTLSVAAGSTLGGGDSGVASVSLVCNGITRVQTFAWSKAKAGVDGVDGADAITVEVVSSQGLVFKNSQVATVLTANVYKGGTLLTSAQVTPLGVVKWYKDGTYLTGKDGLSLTVTAGDVTDRATFEARLDG